MVLPSDTISVTSLFTSPPRQIFLFTKPDHFNFQYLLDQSANKARLLSVSALHAASWLSVVPSIGLCLHMNSDEYQTAVKWWLGIARYYFWFHVCSLPKQCP